MKLIKSSADVQAASKDDVTPLLKAVRQNAQEAAQLLIEHGADVNARTGDNVTPLFYAAQWDTRAVAQLLIERGADVDAERYDVSNSSVIFSLNGPTPIYWAAVNNSPDVAKLLIDHGADIHVKEPNGWTVLHRAAAKNALEVAELLIESGADLNAKDHEGDTPLMAVPRGGQREMAQMLIRHGAEVTLSYAAVVNDRDLAEMLLERGADVDAKDHEGGTTALHHAAKHGAFEVAELLIDRGAIVGAKNNSGDTPLRKAVIWNARKVAALLIDRGADANEKNRDGQTLLHLAALLNAREAALELIAHGADIQAGNSTGDTPLHTAAAGNAREAALTLIEHGADVRATNTDGQTPWDVATQADAQDVLAVLRKWSAEKDLRAIAERYRQWTEAALLREEWQQAQAHLQMLRRVNPSHPALALLETRLEEVQAREIRQKLEQWLEMVRVDGGSFTMGCQSGRGWNCEDDEKPAHRVQVESFEIAKYEVTQALWEAVMGENPSWFGGCPECPVERVNWEDIEEFLAELNARTGGGYRLPTEAEWEYAARGGRHSKGYQYAGSDNAGLVAWYKKNSPENKTHPVGQKWANELGLHDMSGNVWEWVQDCWNDGYEGAPNDGGAWEGGDCSMRVVRGGSWNYHAQVLRSVVRSRRNAGSRLNHLGFRIVRTLTR